MLASSVVGLCATFEILNHYMGEAGGRADRSELQHDSQPWQNRIQLLLLYYDFPHANTQKKNSVKNVFVIYRVLCLTAH
jgi:hypothetical protein